MVKAILFDFDGVIVDSRKATIEYFQETLRHFKLPVPSKDAFKTLLGLKTIDILKNLIPQISKEKLKTIYDYSREMSVKAVVKTTLIPHTIDVLEELSKKYPLALITNRGKETVQILFKQYDLAKYFVVTIDREGVALHKPHPQGIFIALKKLGVSGHDAIFVGDMKEDVLAAHNADLPCIIISPSPQNYGADYHLKHIKDSPSLIDKINEK